MAALMRPSRKLPQLFAAAAGAVLNHLKRPLDAERSTYLARRIFLERQEKSANDVYAGNHRPEFVTPPAGIHHRVLLIALPRVLTQIGHEWNVGGLLGAGEQVALDGLEAKFPVIVPQRGKVAIVGEVEKFLPRSLGNVTLEERHEVVTVEMV